ASFVIAAWHLRRKHGATLSRDPTRRRDHRALGISAARRGSTDRGTAGKETPMPFSIAARIVVAAFALVLVNPAPGRAGCDATTTTTTLPIFTCETNSPEETCGGTCPSGEVCGPVIFPFGLGCACLPPSPCGGSAVFPTCGGTCPSGEGCGQVCVPFGGCGCTCFPAGQCEGSAPTCGGTCPSGQVCGQASGESFCECVPSDQTCDISQ